MSYFEMADESDNVRTGFSFSPSSVSGVLSGIRTRLIHWIGEVKPREVTVVPPSNRECAAHRQGWSSRFFGVKRKRLDCLHPIVVSTASKLYKDGHYRQAVLDTYIALVQRVKEVSGRFDLDNGTLMQFVFRAKDPVIVLSDDPDERLGFMWLFTGAVMGVRNPKAHRSSARMKVCRDSTVSVGLRWEGPSRSQPPRIRSIQHGQIPNGLKM